MTEKRSRVGIYVRVSQAGQGGEEDSTDRQAKRCRAYAESQNWEVAETYTDSGITAFKEKVRPGWKKLMKDAQAGNFDRVLVFAVSRAGRDVANLLTDVKSLRSAGVEFASATEPIDTGSDFGPVILALLGSIAEMESRTKAERAKSKHIAIAEAGGYAGSYRPFGFERVGGSTILEQVPAEAAAIRSGAESYVNGGTLQGVADSWNAAGLTTVRGGRFRVDGVRRIFENPLLIGVRQFEGKDHKTGTAILTRGVFDRLAARLEENRANHVARKSDRYLLTGFLVCGLCGRQMVGRPSAGKRRYICVRSGRNHNGINAEAVEHYVGDMASIMLVKAIKVRDPATLSAPLLADLDAIDAKLSAWARRAAEAELSTVEIRAGRAPLAAKRQRIQEQLDALDTVETKPSIIITKEADGSFAAEWGDMIRARVERAVVAPVGRGGRPVPVEDRVHMEWREGVKPPSEEQLAGVTR